MLNLMLDNRKKAFEHVFDINLIQTHCDGCEEEKQSHKSSWNKLLSLAPNAGLNHAESFLSLGKYPYISENSNETDTFNLKYKVNSGGKLSVITRAS